MFTQLLVSDQTSCLVQFSVALGSVHRDGTDFQEPDFGTASGFLIRRPVQFSPMLLDVHRDGSDFQELDFRTDSDLCSDVLSALPAYIRPYLDTV